MLINMLGVSIISATQNKAPPLRSRLSGDMYYERRPEEPLL